MTDIDHELRTIREDAESTRVRVAWLEQDIERIKLRARDETSFNSERARLLFARVIAVRAALRKMDARPGMDWQATLAAIRLAVDPLCDPDNPRDPDDDEE